MDESSLEPCIGNTLSIGEKLAIALRSRPFSQRAQTGYTLAISKR